MDVIENKKSTDDAYQEQNLSFYSISLIKKGSIYDINNGHKVEYWYDIEVKRAEYHLVSGDLNGPFTNYYEDGQVYMKGNYSKNKRDGRIEEYNEKGILSTSYFMKNDLKNGVATTYEGNKMMSTAEYVESMKNGAYCRYLYNEKTGQLLGKMFGQYENDLKEGVWTVNLIKEGKESVVTKTTFENDLKNGPLQDVKGDSLILGKFKNNLLDGSYHVFVDLKKILMGGFISTDTNDLIKIYDGYFENNKKTGLWKTNDITQTLRSEGNYQNSKKNGKWKYFLTKYLDNDKKELPYSGK